MLNTHCEIHGHVPYGIISTSIKEAAARKRRKKGFSVLLFKGTHIYTHSMTVLPHCLQQVTPLRIRKQKLGSKNPQYFCWEELEEEIKARFPPRNGTDSLLNTHIG